MTDSVIKRHIDFWKGTNTTPLRATLPHPGWTKKPYPLSGGRFATDPVRIGPADVDIDRLLGAANLPDADHTDDYIRGVKPVYPVACMESVIGCPIYAGDTSCFARPYDSVSDIDASSMQAWENVLGSVLKREAVLAGDRLPALQLHLRGVVDMIAAYWGEERMCLSMFDNPSSIHSLSAEFAARYVEMASSGIDSRPEWRGGYVSHWGLYSPEPILDYQVDATSILSRSQYDEFFLEVDRDILSRFPRSVVHLHACGLHIAPSIAAISKSRAIEINLDREAGAFRIDEIIDVMKLLQKSEVRVILNGELSDSEADRITEALSPAGLAIFYWQPVAAH